MLPTKVLLAVSPSGSRIEYECALRRLGFQVTTADDGLMCLEALRQHTPNVVVLDPELLWGGGDGIAAVLLDNPETRSVPVVLLSTHAGGSAVYRISVFPNDDYLIQPVSPERLSSRVASLALGDQGPCVNTLSVR